MLIRPYQIFVRQDAPRTGKLVAGRTALNTLLGGSETVISRRMCTFTSKILTTERVSRDLLNAVILEATSVAESHSPGFFIEVSGRVVNCWSWDAEEVERVSGKPAREAVPESVYHRPSQGAALRRCIEGFEGQMWKSGVLRVSRWWAQQPTSEEWAHFCRAAGVGDPARVPDIEQGFDLDRNRPRNRLTLQNRLRHVRPREYIIAAFALLAVPAVYFGVRNAVVELDMLRTGAAHAELSVQTQEKRTIVRELTNVTARLDSIRGAMAVSAPLPAMAAAMQAVDAAGGTPETVTLSGDEIRLTFTAEGTISERALVEALEAAPALRQASVSKEGQTTRWIVNARMVPDV